MEDQAPDFGPILIQLIELAGLVLSALATFAGWYFTAWMKSKSRDTRWQGAATRVTTWLTDAFHQTNQTFVAALKEAAKDGKLTAEESKEAFDKTIAQAKKNAGAVGLKEVMKNLNLDEGELTEWMGSQLEALIHRSKG